jgi:hypothetical protein
MTPLDIRHRRLQNQRISAAPFERPEEVVQWLVAVQAQDYFGAKWALGQRLQGATDDHIDRAFREGAILRTHLLRPTWHFVTPADIRWLLDLTAPRVDAVNATMYRRLGLDDALFRRSNAVLAKALEGGQQFTRDELRAGLQEAGINPGDGQRMAYIMMRAELDGIVCSGGRRGRQFTYALLDERAPQTKRPEREEALSELTRRYFMSRGPATVYDLAKWSGLTVADARHGLEGIKSQLEQAVVDGQTYWFSISAPSSILAPAERNPSPKAYLLSVYDEYISGYKDRSAIMDAEVGAGLNALRNALSYIIVIDGRVVGSCRRILQKGGVIVETDNFIQLTEAEKRAIASAADQYGNFLGLPVTLASVP